MSNNPLLDKLRGMNNNGAAAAKPAENPAPVDPEAPSEASDRAGLCVSRGMLSGVDLELENGDVKGVYYSAIQGEIDFNPSIGIRFIYETAKGLWEVTITGNNLREMARDLRLCRRDTIHTRAETVTGIEIKGWKPPAKKP